MLELLVGCPVYKRDWILPHWFEAVEKACELAKVTPVYVFVWEPRDAPTISVIRQQISLHKREYWYRSYEQDDIPATRQWGRDRYMQMVEIRNVLLGLVRSCNPAHFLSLDSDILIHEHAIQGMLEHIEQYDAVGAKTYLSAKGVQCPNYAARIMNGGLYRPDVEGVIRAQVLMAIKMMNPSAYACDYRYNHHGEDIGISAAWQEAGLRLAFDGRYPSKHVMNREKLGEVDRRVGY